MIKISFIMAALTSGIASQIQSTSQPIVESTNKIEPTVVVRKSWKCEDCTPEEQYVLKQLQENTRITDRNAL